MPVRKDTNLKVRKDRPTALSSSAHGSNINAVGFNLDLLSIRDPKLATDIVKNYTKAHKVQESDPKAPDEDFALFAETLTKLFAGGSVDN